jgi:hypothetical protein
VDFFESQDAEHEFVLYFDTLKHRLIDFTKVVFRELQKTGYKFSGPFAYLKHHLSDYIQVAFSMTRKHKMIWHGKSTPRNIASLTSPKSFFKTSRKQIKSCHPRSPN